MRLDFLSCLVALSAATTVFAGPVRYHLRRQNDPGSAVVAGPDRVFEFISQGELVTSPPEEPKSNEKSQPEPTTTRDKKAAPEPITTGQEEVVTVTTTVFADTTLTGEPVPTSSAFEGPIPTKPEATGEDSAPIPTRSFEQLEPIASSTAEDIPATTDGPAGPSPSAGNGGRGKTTKSNQALALEQNRRFAQLNNDSSCDESDPAQLIACIGGSLVRCENGSYKLAFECLLPTKCFALPLESRKGLSVACVTVADAAARIGVEPGKLEGITGGGPGPAPGPAPTATAGPPSEPAPVPSSAIEDPAPTSDPVPEPTQNKPQPPATTASVPEVGPTSVDNSAGAPPITTATPAPSNPAAPAPEPPVISTSIVLITMTTVVTSVTPEPTPSAPVGNPNAPVVSAID